MRIVIVEDEPRIREGLARLIGKIKPDYEIVGSARDGAETAEKTASTAATARRRIGARTCRSIRPKPQGSACYIFSPCGSASRPSSR